ncbi:Oidioi.mRNA.OKI2018_I69.XSR.g13378.t1.cds [Oikopleura dioica]|uniref:Oidioi.mRNA.OKI2018_I69.XSR.g13378.t1.cds n=1 Tax=Oikopleura dioica TaxID=34765 RepID=A0ABN7SCT9_OIKDI|nr:Oidioi.mRNA.OKI2018_I69.XSR.g13378.t1.cds [Oikopleura dioica]
MEALQRLKELSFGHREKIRKVQSESQNSSSGSWLRRLKLGKSKGRKSLPPLQSFTEHEPQNSPTSRNAWFRSSQSTTYHPQWSASTPSRTSLPHRGGGAAPPPPLHHSSQWPLSDSVTDENVETWVNSSLVQCPSCTQSSMRSSLSTDTVEDRRNELIKVRNSKLLCKEEATLTENEKIIRRSLEKVNSWLKELPNTFDPVTVPENETQKAAARGLHGHYFKDHRV